MTLTINVLSLLCGDALRCIFPEVPLFLLSLWAETEMPATSKMSSSTKLQQTKTCSTTCSQFWRGDANILVFKFEYRTLHWQCPLSTAQCAFWVVRWPCGQMAVAVKTLSHGKTIVLRLFFLYCFRKKNFKTCIAFHFWALEALFLEHSKLVKMTRKSQI